MFDETWLWSLPQANREMMFEALPGFHNYFGASLHWYRDLNYFMQKVRSDGNNLHIISNMPRGVILPPTVWEWLKKECNYNTHSVLEITDWPHEFGTILNQDSGETSAKKKFNHFLLHLPSRTILFKFAYHEFNWVSAFRDTVADGLKFSLLETCRFNDILPCLTIREEDAFVDVLQHTNYGHLNGIPLVRKRPKINHLILFGPVTFTLIKRDLKYLYEKLPDCLILMIIETLYGAFIHLDNSISVISQTQSSARAANSSHLDILNQTNCNIKHFLTTILPSKSNYFVDEWLSSLLYEEFYFWK